MPLNEASPQSGGEAAYFPQPQTVYGKKAIKLNGQAIYVHETGCLKDKLRAYLRADPALDSQSRTLLDALATQEPEVMELLRYVDAHSDSVSSEAADFIHSGAFEVLALLAYTSYPDIDPNQLVEYPSQT